MTSSSFAAQTPAITIRELSTAEMPQIEHLTRQLNAPHMSAEAFAAHLARMLPQGYRCAGLWHGDNLVAITGFWIFTRFWCGTQMDLDNVIVDEAHRRHGYGKKLLAWLEAKAVEEGVETIVLDSYSASDKAHRFYYDAGYFIKGFHFIKPLVSRPLTGDARPLITA